MAENCHKGHRQRMREDFAKAGFSAWQKHRVLEFLLFNVIPVADTNETAHRIIRECGGFVNVFHASKDRLMQINGVGEKVADFLVTLGEFMRCYNSERYNADVFVLNTEESNEYLFNLFADKKRECCYMICLDAKNHIIGLELLFEGSSESVELDVSQVLRMAVKDNAIKVVITHNHPSGVLTPSESDLVTTKILRQTLQYAGIKLLDHIIVSDDTCKSIFASEVGK